MNDEQLLDLLHSSKNLSPKIVEKIWSLICENSDGVDVEKLRESLSNNQNVKINSKESVAKTLQYKSKSKMNLVFWDSKEFQIRYLFGIAGEEPQAAREGKNKHIISETIPSSIEESKLISAYQKDTTIYNYIESIASTAFAESVSEAVGTKLSLNKALAQFNKDEAEGYINAIHAISLDYNIRLNKILKYRKLEDAFYFLVPKFKEVIIWNHIFWLNGVVDAIFLHPLFANNYIPVDYKFGKPKDKYYIEGIELEMAFYNRLIATDGEYANDFKEEKKIWKPLFSPEGQMWYIMDGERGLFRVGFNEKTMAKYDKAYQKYWRIINNFEYDYDPSYAFNRSRYNDYCSIPPNGKCGVRKICELSKSYRLCNDVNPDVIEFFKGIE